MKKEKKLTNYEKRSEAAQIIENMIKRQESIDLSRIYYEILTRYGFSRKFCNEVIGNLEALEYVILDVNKVVWVKVPNQKEIKDNAEATFVLKNIQLASQREEEPNANNPNP